MISIDMVLEGLLAAEAGLVAVGAGVGEHALEVQALYVVTQLPPASDSSTVYCEILHNPNQTKLWKIYFIA